MNVNDKIIARELQGETVLLNMENGDYFTLNSMGTEIYNHICAGRDIEEITDILLEEYDVGRSRLKEDVAALIDELRKKNILTE